MAEPIFFSPAMRQTFIKLEVLLWPGLDDDASRGLDAQRAEKAGVLNIRAAAANA